MADKTSFILHLSNRPQWDLLSYEQKGRLIEAIYTYVESCEQIETDDGMLKMAFSIITGQIDRDAEKYSKRCKINKQIADERERQKRERNGTNVHERAEVKTNPTEYDSDCDNDNDDDGDYESEMTAADKPRRKPAAKRFVPPDVSEVRAYCRERQNGIDAQYFVDFYTANGWVQGKGGKPIRDWRAVVRTWEMQQDKYRSERKKPPDKLENRSISGADLEALMQPYAGGAP